MLPQGFLGTRADVLMDLVIVSLAAILPLLAFAWLRARARDFTTHKRTQVTLGSVLGVVVVLFETDMRMAGGIFELTKGSRFAGTALLNWSIGIHTLLSITTSILWVWLIVQSLRKFPVPAAPSSFSPTHRRWGTIGMIWMALTGITGIELYVVGFAL